MVIFKGVMLYKNKGWPCLPHHKRNIKEFLFKMWTNKSLGFQMFMIQVYPPNTSIS